MLLSSAILILGFVGVSLHVVVRIVSIVMLRQHVASRELNGLRHQLEVHRLMFLILFVHGVLEELDASVGGASRLVAHHPARAKASSAFLPIEIFALVATLLIGLVRWIHRRLINRTLMNDR